MAGSAESNRPAHGGKLGPLLGRAVCTLEVLPSTKGDGEEERRGGPYISFHGPV